MNNEQNIMQYNEAAMERFKTLLETATEKGTPKYYEIVVDNLKVIEKTNDVNEFDNYLSFITDSTSQIQILIYTNNLKSPRHTKYTFITNAEKENKGSELSGVEIQNRITQGIQAEREKWERDVRQKELQNELKEKDELIKENDKYITELENTILGLRQNRNTFKGIHLGEVAGVAVEALIRNNVHFLEQFPATKSLAGLIAQDNEQQKLQPPATPENAEVQFSAVQKTATTLSEEDQQLLQFMKQLQGTFNEDELKALMEIIQRLGEDTTQIQTVKELLNNNN
ncbi:MAG: hypothetical protein RJA07_473 [Bacteroidota bacterium]|jgi:hypothetical protein